MENAMYSPVAALAELIAPDEEDLDRRAGPSTATLPLNPIKALDQDVVNQIAAGEIIQRPANALKELIENSLDAGSTSIRITLKDGGLKMLQVQDNGSGVRPEDLPLLCQRFATSKLREFSDLSNMTTFGFRGEALASLSYVSASMTVVSKTRDEACAYRASYLNGALTSPKPGQPSAPRPCAGTDGTSITAESLFYNAPMRLRSLKSPADEYNRCLDVASKYAVHYGGRGVGFVCKKASSNTADLSTPGAGAGSKASTLTTLDTIRALHGSTVARELVRLKPVRNERLGFAVEGWISGPNWSAKKSTLLCFINNRLVDCTPLRRALEAMYAGLLPKGGHPWLYISLEIDPTRMDVNVHPTKREVHFLDEEEVVESVCVHAESCLASVNSSRTFTMTQTLLPGASEPPSKKQRTEEDDRRRSSGGLPISSQRGYPQHLVRVDAKAQTLDSFGFGASQVGSRLGSGSGSSSGSGSALPSSSRTFAPSSDLVLEEDEEGEDDDVVIDLADDDEDATQRNGKGKAKVPDDEEMEDAEGEEELEGHAGVMRGDDDDERIQETAAKSRPPTASSKAVSSTQALLSSHQTLGSSSQRPKTSKRLRDGDCSLTSVRELRAEILKSRHTGMTEVFQNHTFVGVAALEYGKSLVQHSTKLYMINHDKVIEEFAYQLVIRQFGQMGEVRLEPAPKVSDLVSAVMDDLDGWESTELSREEVIQRIEQRLMSNADMVLEYFSIRFDKEESTLCSVPSLLPMHGTAAVQSQRIGLLLIRLVTEVDWTEEKPCFEGIARELAKAAVPCIDGLDVPALGERTDVPTNGAIGISNGEAQSANGTTVAASERDEERAQRQKEDKEEWDRQAWLIQHAWYAQMGPERCGFIAPKSLLEDGSVVQIANLPDLYRVFERC
ncbi:DNA mismatch repair protein Mlh1 [Tilletia horrida]|nr:DNA mismatch repair protein Mlh1 [Tilletia horrida]